MGCLIFIRLEEKSGKAFLEELILLTAGIWKNEGYPRLRENCSKENMKESLPFGYLLVDGSGWSEC